jgi:hypothetical protein
MPTLSLPQNYRLLRKKSEHFLPKHHDPARSHFSQSSSGIFFIQLRFVDGVWFREFFLNNVDQERIYAARHIWGTSPSPFLESSRLIAYLCGVAIKTNVRSPSRC